MKNLSLISWDKIASNASTYLQDDVSNRKLVYDFLRRMTDYYPLNRPKISECIAFFSKVRAEVTPMQKTIPIVFLDIEDYLKK